MNHRDPSSCPSSAMRNAQLGPHRLRPAGLAVAIPAVLAYNVFGRLIGRIEADLEGFALDLRELLASPGAEPPRSGSSPSGSAQP